jgi:aryl-alcohol dehydrogenase-like predicted oxidoreductase
MGRLERFVSERGHTVGELAIAWLLGHASVCSVIAGATKPEQVVSNVKAAEWRLTVQEMEEVKALLDRQA